MSFFSKPSVLFVSAATVIIVFTIVITAAVQSSTLADASLQTITVGPVWKGDGWDCTSDEDYVVHGALIAYDEPNSLTIFQSDRGTQPDIRFTPLEMQSFTVGGPADSHIEITKVGNITGFITLETSSGANASCTQIGPA